MTKPIKAHTQQPANHAVNNQQPTKDWTFIAAWLLMPFLILAGLYVGWRRLMASMGFRTVRDDY